MIPIEAVEQLYAVTNAVLRKHNGNIDLALPEFKELYTLVPGMDPKHHCPLCHKLIEPDADVCTVKVLTAGDPETTVVHTKCRDRNARSFARLMMKEQAKQARQR